jgi:hypothetical protein
MIRINRDILELRPRLSKIRLRKRGRNRKVPGASNIQSPELSVVGDVLRGGVKRLEGRGLELGCPGADLVVGQRVEERDGGREAGVVVPVDAARAFEAEPGRRDLANVGAGAGKLGDVGEEAGELDEELERGGRIGTWKRGKGLGDSRISCP